MSIWAYIVLVVVIFAGGAGTGLKWEKGQEAIREVARAEKAHEDWKRQERGVDVAAAGHEKDKEGLHTKFVVITERVNDVIKTDFYAAGAPACFDDAGLQQLRAAVATAPAATASQPAGGLPGPGPAHWWQPRRDPALVDSGH